MPPCFLGVLESHVLSVTDAGIKDDFRSMLVDTLHALAPLHL